MPAGLIAAALAVVASSAALMSFEILAARLLMAHFANNIFVWSAVIGTVIVGLTLGYAAGGILAERRADDRRALIAGELLAGGALMAAAPWIYGLLSGSYAPPRDYYPLHPPLLACLAAFGLPSFVLAGVSPACVSLLVEAGLGAALASGVAAALSAFGSAFGLFGVVYCLIPRFGVRALFAASGAGLGLLALLVPTRRPSPKRAALLAAIYAAAVGASGWADTRPALDAVELTLATASGPLAPVYSRDSAYQLLRVFRWTEKDGPATAMLLDSGKASVGFAGRPPTGYYGAYRMFVNAVAGRRDARILFIGGGGYVMPAAAGRELPEARIDVAELDPAVRDAAARFFGDPGPNVRTVVEDGRRLLRGRRALYDGIFVDGYEDLRVMPFQLMTREFFERASAALRPGGVIGLNVVGRLDEREGLVCSIARTLSSTFAAVDLYPAATGASNGVVNIVIVARKDPDAMAPDRLMRATGLSRRVDARSLACRSDAPLLTDDYAPVEWLASRYNGR